MKVEDGRYRFLAGISASHDVHEVRLRNPIRVYANEIAAVPAACDAVRQGLEKRCQQDRTTFAKLLFDDEMLSFDLSGKRYAEPHHHAINMHETATESGEPYLFLPEGRRKLGIVMVHGLLASPAELRSFGEELQRQGYPVAGVRLKGHGTSPWDLRDRNWQDWMMSVRRGYEILDPFVDAVCLVGFSLGGVLALRLAAESPVGLAGVVAVSAPIKLRNKNLVFVPVVHGANKLAKWTSSLEGIVPFRLNHSEHPETNYRHIPIRALYELRRAIDDLSRQLSQIVCPVAVFQGARDQVVAPKSARIIHEQIGADEKWLHWIESDRHGVLGENVEGCQDKVLRFIESLETASTARQPVDWNSPTARALFEAVDSDASSIRV